MASERREVSRDVGAGGYAVENPAEVLTQGPMAVMRRAGRTRLIGGLAAGILRPGDGWGFYAGYLTGEGEPDRNEKSLETKGVMMHCSRASG